MIEDLQIIGKNKVRKVFTKGPKYRETNNILWLNLLLIHGLSDCVDTRCRKYGIAKSVFKKWKGKVIGKVDEK